MVKYGVVQKKTLFTPAQMFVLMVFGGPRLPLAFQFVCGPPLGRKQIRRQVESFSLFGCAAAGGRGIQYK